MAGQKRAAEGGKGLLWVAIWKGLCKRKALCSQNKDF